MTTHKTVTAFHSRVKAHQHNPDSDALKELCNEISISELAGTNTDFVLLWETLVDIRKGSRSLSEHAALRKAIKHVFQEKDRVAPKSEEVDPSGLRPVRFVRR